MSLVDDKRVHARAEVNLKAKATLVLSQELITQIHYLHHRVARNTEWSGVLVYNTVSGNVNAPDTWVVKASTLIPMDVGSSGYTEYEYSPNDAYSFDRVTKHMMAGEKLGHIHTHHSMGTFFSGTDKSELHDNAPQHAYYLSLIVDYKEPAFWCAKIAICGSIKEEGVKKTTGILKTVRDWFDADGKKRTFEEEADLDNEEVVNTERQVLYIIDCDIVLEEEADAFQKRVTQLCIPKRPAYTGTGAYLHGTGVGAGRSLTVPSIFDQEKYEESRGKQSGVSAVESTNSKVKAASISVAGSTVGDDGMDNAFTPGKVRPFLIKFLSEDHECDLELSSVMQKFINLSDAAAIIKVDRLQDAFEMDAFVHFENIDPRDGVSNMTYFHAIVVAIDDLLRPWAKHTKYNMLMDMLETDYLLSSNQVSHEETFRLTGIVMDDAEILMM